MKFNLLIAATVANLVMFVGYNGSPLISTSSAAVASGCEVAKPPAGAAKTTVKSWSDPRPCDWAQKYPLFAPPASGDGSLQRVQDAGGLTICAETDQPPGVYSDPTTGKRMGYEPDILENLVERLGIKKYSYVEVQFPNYIPAIQAKKCDAVVGVIGITSQRAQAPGMRYTWPYLVEGDRVIVLKDSSYQHISDLKGQKIAVVPGSVEDLEAKQIVADLGGGTAIAEFPSDAIAYTAMFSKQAAAVIDVSLALIQRPDAAKLRQLPDPPPAPPDSTSPYNRLSVAAITAASDNDLNIAMSIALEDMKEDGTLQKIFTTNKSYLPGVLDYVSSNIQQ
jgi:ABC-type amino acid transport substrate-binding protein